jgi:hypothetical protein
MASSAITSPLNMLYHFLGIKFTHPAIHIVHQNISQNRSQTSRYYSFRYHKFLCMCFLLCCLQRALLHLSVYIFQLEHFPTKIRVSVARFDTKVAVNFGDVIQTGAFFLFFPSPPVYLFVVSFSRVRNTSRKLVDGLGSIVSIGSIVYEVFQGC